jgi:pimeloyl-ACP methyl ester carboxylesterase
VVLVHGLRGSTRDFEHSVVDMLARRYRVVAVDRPGYGYSERLLTDGASPAAQAELLHGTLQQLGVERPVLVGHSMGAAVVMAYATRFPDETAAFVTLCGHVLPFDGGAGPLAGLVARPVFGALFLRFLVTPLGLLVGPVLLRHVFAPQRPPADYARAATLLAVRPHSFLASSRDRQGMDAGLRAVSKGFAALRPPGVLVAGRADRVVSPNESLSLHRIVPRSELVVLPGVGHMPHFAQPTAVLEAVERAWALADEAARGSKAASRAAH